ncbi:hypothetical protein NOCA120127 [metagenome]|uniref:Uncharacterized protein n=1 Tax=metagenome TaxID=256318 RepID=A0A2P2CE23_9ZZZZ
MLLDQRVARRREVGQRQGVELIGDLEQRVGHAAILGRAGPAVRRERCGPGPPPSSWPDGEHLAAEGSRGRPRAQVGRAAGRRHRRDGRRRVRRARPAAVRRRRLHSPGRRRRAVARRRAAGRGPRAAHRRPRGSIEPAGVVAWRRPGQHHTSPPPDRARHRRGVRSPPRVILRPGCLRLVAGLTSTSARLAWSAVVDPLDDLRQTMNTNGWANPPGSQPRLGPALGKAAALVLLRPRSASRAPARAHIRHDLAEKSPSRAPTPVRCRRRT